MTLLGLGIRFDFEIHRLTQGRRMVSRGGMGKEQTLRAENHRLGVGNLLSLGTRKRRGEEEQAGIG